GLVPGGEGRVAAVLRDGELHVRLVEGVRVVGAGNVDLNDQEAHDDAEEQVDEDQDLAEYGHGPSPFRAGASPGAGSAGRQATAPTVAAERGGTMPTGP